MNHTIKISFLSATLAALALPVMAQSTTQTAPQSTPPVTGQSLQQRKDNQQDRIANGVKSGQLTAGETVNLERKESGINNEERNMRQQNGGTLTSADKQTINRQQNAMSNQIYNDKHNSTTRQAPKTEVGQREANQQGRIAQGVASGQLTAGEAKHLEGNEQKINNEVQSERAANGGKLTQQQRQQVNRQQNQQSRQIYRDKHNPRKQ